MTTNPTTTKSGKTGSLTKESPNMTPRAAAAKPRAAAKPKPAEPWLKFLERSHQYRLRPLPTEEVPDPKHLPVKGVTTLIKGGTEAGALVRWAPKVVAQWIHDNPQELAAMREQLVTKMLTPEAFVRQLADLPNQVRDAAALKGKDIHALAEDLQKGIEVDVPEPYLAKVHGYVRFLDEFDVEPILTEAPCANRTHWYAGTLDSVARFGPGAPAKVRGRVFILDWKTSNGVYGDTSMQLAAYRNAEAWQDPENPMAENPMPAEIDAMGVVHITDDGSWLYDLGDMDAAFTEFLHVAHTTKTAARRKALIGDGLILPPSMDEEDPWGVALAAADIEKEAISA
jgi:hypothetical protein